MYALPALLGGLALKYAELLQLPPRRPPPRPARVEGREDAEQDPLRRDALHDGDARMEEPLKALKLAPSGMGPPTLTAMREAVTADGNYEMGMTFFSPNTPYRVWKDRAALLALLRPQRPSSARSTRRSASSNSPSSPAPRCAPAHAARAPAAARRPPWPATLLPGATHPYPARHTFLPASSRTRLGALAKPRAPRRPAWPHITPRAAGTPSRGALRARPVAAGRGTSTHTRTRARPAARAASAASPLTPGARRACGRVRMTSLSRWPTARARRS